MWHFTRWPLSWSCSVLACAQAHVCAVAAPNPRECGGAQPVHASLAAAADAEPRASQELQSYLSELGQWTQDVKHKDTALKGSVAAPTAVPVRGEPSAAPAPRATAATAGGAAAAAAAATTTTPAADDRSDRL